MPSCNVNVTTPVINGSQFIVSGSLTGYNTSPTLEYQDNGGGWNALPNTAIITPTYFSFNHPSIQVRTSNTIAIRDHDQQDITATSATFQVYAALVESDQGTILTGPSNNSIYDINLHAYNLVATSAFGNQVTADLAIDSTTANVVRLLYYNHQIFYENADGNFFSKVNSTSAWRQTTDPAISIPKSCTIAVPNSITANVAFTVNGSLLEYTITPVLEYSDDSETWLPFPSNSETSSTSYQFLHPGIAFQNNLLVSVRDKNIHQVIATSANITVNKAIESSDGTSLYAGTSDSIVDGNGNFWSVNPSGSVTMNGVVDQIASGCLNLYYSNHTIFYQSRNQSWFKRPDINKQWILSASPYINGPNSEQAHIIASQQSVDFLIAQLTDLLTRLQPSPIIN